MKLIAVDVGSGFTKFAKGEKGSAETSFFSSVVTPFPEKNVFGMKEGDFIEFNNAKYLTDDTARNFGQPYKRFDTTNEDWHGEHWWFALLYKAIALSFSPEEINGKTLNLATGIPQKIFSDMKHTLERKLNKEHSFKYGEKAYQFKMKSTVIPQAAGALIYNAYKDHSLIDSMVGVIDIGTFTTGLSVIDNGTPVEHKSTGLSKGMSNIYNLLAEELRKEYGYSTDPVKMPGIIKNRKALIMGEEVDLSEEILKVSEVVSINIIEKINESWGNAGDMQVFITGGGADTFYQAVKKSIPHLKQSVSGVPFFDVVLGMHSYTESRVSNG